MSIEHRHDMGSGGECICPKCETRIFHRDGIPCQDEHCPKCGAKMLRKGSYHHELFEKKRATNKHKEEK